MKFSVANFCEKVADIAGFLGQDGVSLHAPSFNQDDIRAVENVVQSGWVSYQGRAVSDFEEALSNYTGIPNVITTVNGTEALFISLKALGVKTGDEIIVPALTFIATANAVVHANATPHFVDVDEKTLAIDWEKLEDYLSINSYFGDDGYLINKHTKRPIKGIIPVHILGAAFDINRAIEIAKKYNLLLIEDSAEALGSKFGDTLVAGFSGIGILSFNGNKIITTGGGGAICIKNQDLAAKIRHMSTTAKVSHNYEFIHDKVGYNLRLPALNAALGLSQLKRIATIVQKKRALNEIYAKSFKNSDFGQIYDPDSYGESNCWLNAFVLNDDHAHNKNLILDALHLKNIFARPLWKPLNALEIYRDYPSSDCSGAYNIYERVICLPSSPSLVSYEPEA